jgi:hypothetical protein
MCQNLIDIRIIIIRGLQIIWGSHIDRLVNSFIPCDELRDRSFGVPNTIPDRNGICNNDVSALAKTSAPLFSFKTQYHRHHPSFCLSLVVYVDKAPLGHP